MLCENRINAVKAHGPPKVVVRPRKKPGSRRSKPGSDVVTELRRLAAFRNSTDVKRRTSKVHVNR